MPVCGIKRKRVNISLPIAAYNSLEQLAQKEGLSIHQYSKRILEREIQKNNLPIYWQGEIES